MLTLAAASCGNSGNSNNVGEVGKGPSTAALSSDGDPLFPQQWYLENTGQNGGSPGEDINLTGIASHFTGDGITIGIVDDGLDWEHEDLISNFDPTLCFDYFEQDSNPSHGATQDYHGTVVAGIAAARGNNGRGIAGVAPNAMLAGLRILDSSTASNTTDHHIASALTAHCNEIQIYNNSWGRAYHNELDAPAAEIIAALKQGVTNCRGGLGSIYVFGAGNSDYILDGFDSNYDGITNSRYTIAVAATDANGKQSPASVNGANILVNAPAADVSTDPTDSNGYSTSNYVGVGQDTGDRLSGTSLAAPVVSGVVALMLEANPYLTWRDVQQILIETATKNDPTDSDWTTNGAGYPINHKYGFGRVNAEAAVDAAVKRAGTMLAWESQRSNHANVGRQIPDNSDQGIESHLTLPDDLKVENVEVTFDSDHPNWGELEVVLISPSGTQSVLAASHLTVGGTFENWKFGTIRHYGESSGGDWILRVKDLRGPRGSYPSDVGNFRSWSITVYGTNKDSSTGDTSNGTNDNTSTTDDGKVPFNVDIRAKGTTAGGVCPKIEVVYAERTTLATFDICSPEGNYATYQIRSSVDPAYFSRMSLSINYVNDAVVNGEDRNVWVDYVTINGELIQSEGPGVRYRIKTSDAANGMCILGQELMAWNGNLEFPLDWSFVDIEAKGNDCDGWPKLDAYKNNNANPEDGMRRQYVTYSHHSPNGTFVYRHYVNPGSVRNYYIKYINDYCTAGCDRNLSIRSVTFGYHRVLASDPRVFYLDFNDQLLATGSGDMYWGGRLIFDNALPSSGYSSQSVFPADDLLDDTWEVAYGFNVSANDEAQDPDNDGLTNLEEYQHQTNPLVADSDNDEMPDGFEVRYGLNPSAMDAFGDLDNDKLVNVAEHRAGTDPTKADTDGDSMPDLWEISYGLDPTKNDASSDRDDDGLSNVAEYQNNTDPTHADIDRDGLTDGIEILELHTNAFLKDTDRDGIDDGWEATYGLNPLQNDADDDADNDGITNIDEYLKGTNPTVYDWSAVGNVALGKPTTMSSYNFGTTGAEAVDGISDGDFAQGSTSHTHPDNPSWWQVDLQENALIKEVRVYNRSDCCAERLSNFDVMVSSDGVTWKHIKHVADQAGFPTAINFSGVQGRYVRVQLTDVNYLSLAEVEVWGVTL